MSCGRVRPLKHSYFMFIKSNCLLSQYDKIYLQGKLSIDNFMVSFFFLSKVIFVFVYICIRNTSVFLCFSYAFIHFVLLSFFEDQSDIYFLTPGSCIALSIQLCRWRRARNNPSYTEYMAVFPARSAQTFPQNDSVCL